MADEAAGSISNSGRGPAADRDDDARGNLRADHGDRYTLQEVIGDIIDNSIDASLEDEITIVEVFFEECNYTDEEKDMQVRLAYLAPIFCKLPNFMFPMLRFLIKRNLTKVYSGVSSIYESYLRSWHTFPGAQPYNPIHFIGAVVKTIRFVFSQENSDLDRFSNSPVEPLQPRNTYSKALR